MTSREHLELYASIKGVTVGLTPEIVASKLQEVGLSESDSNRLSSKYSGGMKKRLSLACATIGQPQLVFLDECSTGADPVARREIWEMISNMVYNEELAPEDRPCIILTTHSMEECEALCPRIGIMAAGRLRCLGSAQHLKSKFGQGFQVELKVRNVDPKEEDYNSNLRAIAGAVGVRPPPIVVEGVEDEESAVPESAPTAEVFLNLQQTLSALQSLTGDDFLASKLHPDEPAGFVIHKESVICDRGRYVHSGQLRHDRAAYEESEFVH
jgi:ABC-type multidrug transport system ATPase subunit